MLCQETHALYIPEDYMQVLEMVERSASEYKRHMVYNAQSRDACVKKDDMKGKLS